MLQWYELNFPALVSSVDVVLDQDTAHPNIVLSADGKQAGRGELLHLVPDNPQRFDPVICVLASRGFLSGRFYFQVGFSFSPGGSLRHCLRNFSPREIPENV